MQLFLYAENSRIVYYSAHELARSELGRKQDFHRCAPLPGAESRGSHFPSPLSGWKSHALMGLEILTLDADAFS